MLHFENDYTVGACKPCLEALIYTNNENLIGYGKDEYSILAQNKILKACNLSKGSVYFISGGTQTNMFVTSILLKSHQGVISADTGHISLHECGAVERCGHKVLAVKHTDGKIDYNYLKEYLHNFFTDENSSFMVEPGMVYISQPTEYGTLYSKNELKNIYNICKKYNVKTYIDGARLGYALASNEADFTLQDIAKYCDCFYFGGTKIGTLIGEALVFTKETPNGIFQLIKQHGAQLAKGRTIAVQFNALFENNAYMPLCKNAISKAETLKQILKEKGYKFFLETPTNQQFVIVENSALKKLNKKVTTCFWEKYNDTHSVVRFATSWATTDEDLNALRQIL